MGFLEGLGRSRAITGTLSAIDQLKANEQARAINAQNIQFNEMDLKARQYQQQQLAQQEEMNKKILPLSAYFPNMKPGSNQEKWITETAKRMGILEEHPVAGSGIQYGNFQQATQLFKQSKDLQKEFLSSSIMDWTGERNAIRTKLEELKADPKAKPEEIVPLQKQLSNAERMLSEAWTGYSLADEEMRKEMLKQQFGGQQGVGAVDQAAMKIMSENPGMTYTQAFSIARSGAGQGRYFEGGEIKPFKGAPESAGEMKKGEKLGAQQAEIETGAEVERQKELGKEKAKLEMSVPKVRNTLTSLNQQWDLVDKTIDEAINAVNPFTAGVGSWLASVPGSPQKNLSAKLDTIRANIGFDKLQDMRANSPTGGALGQISDMENKLLQSVKGSTDQAQSAAQLKQNLMDIKADLRALKAERNAAFKTDYGQFLKDIEITTKPKRDISKATTWLKSSKDESEAKKKIKQLYSIGRYGDTRNPWTEDELLQIIRDAGYGK